jgi:hypothetical protein
VNNNSLGFRALRVAPALATPAGKSGGEMNWQYSIASACQPRAASMSCVMTGAAHEEPRTETQRFDTTVPALERLRNWLHDEHVTDVVMGSTGSYWIPVVKPRKFVPSEADDGVSWECRAVLVPAKASLVGEGTEHKQPTDSPRS